jgi:hypothetical protein
MSAVERAGSVPLAPPTGVLEPARLAVVGGSDDEGTERELDSLDLSSLRPRRIDWLWPGYVPLRKVTILDGDPGLGKSTLVLDLAARGSIGGVAPSGDRLGDAFTTIYVTAEDDPEDTILPRLLRAGGDPARLRLIVKLNLPADIGRLRRTVLNHHARLVVIDPLVAYLGDGVKTNDDHNVRRALEPLAVMVAEVDGSSGLPSTDEYAVTAWHRGDRILRLGHLRGVPGARCCSFQTFYSVTLIGQGVPPD